MSMSKAKQLQEKQELERSLRTRAKFSDVAYMLHMQLHLDYMNTQYSIGFECPLCKKYPLPDELQHDEDR